jgi:hypothetical protein
LLSLLPPIASNVIRALRLIQFGKKRKRKEEKKSLAVHSFIQDWTRQHTIGRREESEA